MTANNNHQQFPAIEQNDEIDIKRLLYLLLSRWYWLLIGLLLGASMAYLVVKFTPANYLVDTSLLVTNESKGLNVENIFMENMMGNAAKVTLQNEVEFLNSFTLNYQAVDNLNWQTFWQKKNLVIWNGIYLDEPFILNKSGEALNPSGISYTLHHYPKHNIK
nr:Wzz/FepE/Etk N-terminal domain-containing protein [uncultured Draconibacterium sp.]